MTTKFNIDSSKRYAPTGYEGENFTENYVIPSCGVEDLDKSVFDLFDKEIPLFYNIHGEKHRVPVIFATGERFALLRRKKPLLDKSGALILPLVSITRNNIDNVPTKGIANNQMFPHVVTKRLSQKDLEYRQIKNFENLNNINGEGTNNETDLNLKPRITNNIVETIEIPAIKYFSASYEISIWSSFTQQMNRLIEAIMSSYTLNPGQQFKLTSDKGYWFNCFVDSGLSADTNYADMADAERYVRYNMTLNATGYIIAPNIEGGKTALRSFISAPEVKFEYFGDLDEFSPQEGSPVVDPRVDAHMLDDLATEDSYAPSQMASIGGFSNSAELLETDASKGYATKVSKRVFVETKDGNKIQVTAKQGPGQGETLYDASIAKYLFDD